MKKLLLVILLVMAQPIFALSASIQPPKMVLRGEAPGSVSGFVDVMNPNNESVTVDVTPRGDIAGLLELSNTNITLEFNETKRVDFDIELKSPGNYTGEILFVFKPPEGQGIALSSQIIVIAQAKSGTTSDQDWTLAGIVLGIVIIAIISIIIFRGRMK